MTYKIITDNEKMAMRVHSHERVCNRRATFHVYHVDKKGKTAFDPSWAPTVDGAAMLVDSMYREIRNPVTVLHVVPVKPVEL